MFFIGQQRYTSVLYELISCVDCRVVGETIGLGKQQFTVVYTIYVPRNVILIQKINELNVQSFVFQS